MYTDYIAHILRTCIQLHKSHILHVYILKRSCVSCVWVYGKCILIILHAF